MATETLFFDLAHLCPLGEAVEALAPTAPPAPQVIAGPDLALVRRVGVLSGSFNPVTNAHLALADAALATGRIDVLEYLLATRTVNKEQIEGTSLPDRLLCLESVVDERPKEGVLLVNRGLLVDQASLIRESWPSLDELWFVVGFDKIVQIFDPRYYDDIDVALDRLFDLASFLVAPRGTDGAAELSALLNTARNRRYATRVQLLDLPESYRALSSTRFRTAMRGRQQVAGVPPTVEEFSAATGAYQPALTISPDEKVDRYAIRQRLIDRACVGTAAWPTPEALRAFWLRAIAPDSEGRRLRQGLTDAN